MAPTDFHPAASKVQQRAAWDAVSARWETCVKSSSEAPLR
jgi:hypothetical protein